MTLALAIQSGASGSSISDGGPAHITITPISNNGVVPFVEDIGFAAFGATAINCRPSGSIAPYIRAEVSANLNFGSADFTLIIRSNKRTSDDEIFIPYNLTNASYDNCLNIAQQYGVLSCDFQTTTAIGGQTYHHIVGPSATDVWVWQYIVLVRSGGNLTLGMDGAMGTPFAIGTAAIKLPATPFIKIGHCTANTAYIDELIAIKGEALYTGSTFTVPTARFSVPSLGVADVALSLPSLSSKAHSGGRAALTLPRPLAAAAGTVQATGNASMTLPSLSTYAISYPVGGPYSEANMQLPSLTVAAQGHDSTRERAAALELPGLSVSSRAGANANISLPGLSNQVAGTVTSVSNAELTLPSLSAAAGATVASTGNAAITLPSMSGKSYAGALCSVTIGTVTMESIGTTGAVGGASISLPLFEVASFASAQNHGSAHLTLPSLSLHSGGNGAAITLPGLELVAIGSAVITATYEAYAINLLQPLDSSPSNQYDAKVPAATHYTNFPFTHVVRYKNSYYGANSTGLYLLEGTTDDGAPIPFDVKTCETDFGAPEHKTVESAYLAGRLGSAATVTLTAREETTVTQAFVTPRSTKPQNHRQGFARGLKARYFALGISGEKEFELDTVDLSVGTTKRRI